MLLDVIFFALLFAVLAYEGYAIINRPRTGDTISEHTWSFRNHSLLGRILVDTLVVWLLYHLLLDPTFFQEGTSFADLIVVALGVSWAVFSWNWSQKRK